MNRETQMVTETMSFLMLPDDLVVNCLARISRLHYPTLFLVSKRLRSLLNPLELYKTRTLLSRTESCLYLCLEFSRDTDPTWFTLCRRPPIQITDPNPKPKPKPRWFTQCFAPYSFQKKEKKLSEHFFASVQTQSSVSVSAWDLISFGYNIYKIGGYNNGSPKWKVFFMDCRTHTWHEAPSMRIARVSPLVSVLDGKIYVVGGNTDCDSSNWIECFDPKTQIWEVVQCPDEEIHKSLLLKSIAVEGKLYLFGNNSVVYSPKENRWDELGFNEVMSSRLFPQNFCVVDNILYSYRWSRKLQWYDSEVRAWRVLKGLEKMRKSPRHDDYVRLVDHGGKMALLWEEDLVYKNKKFWCAEISLERRNGQEIYGKVEWCDVVLTVPKSCDMMQVVAITV